MTRFEEPHEESWGLDPATVDPEAVIDTYLANERESGEPVVAPSNSTPLAAETKVTVQVEAPRRGTFRRRARMVGGAALLAAVGFAGYSAWQFFKGHDATHQFKSEIIPKETKVFPDVSLNLARIESTFHLDQHTVLDRADDALFDWNPFDYNTTIKEDITTEVSAGVKVGRLVATKDPKDKSMTVVIDGNISTTTPAVDWNKNKLDIQIGSVDIGVGTGEINKARNSAERMVQAAGGIATACALRDSDVQVLFGDGVADFLATTSFADGIDPAKISVVITDLDSRADDVYEKMLEQYSATKKDISRKYNGKENTFEVKDDKLTNCDAHKITIVSEE